MGKNKIKIPPADPVSYLMVVTMSGCFFSMRGARASSFNSSRAEMHCGIDRVRIQTETRRLRQRLAVSGSPPQPRESPGAGRSSLRCPGPPTSALS